MVSGTYQKFRAAQQSRSVGFWLVLTLLFLLAPRSARAASLPACAGDDATPVSLHPDYGDGARFAGIRLRGALRLSSRRVDGFSVHGLSGLAWSPVQQTLVAVSDLGFVLHFLPRFHDGSLVGVSYCAAHALRDDAGAPLEGRWRDAEGLSLRPGAGGSAEELLVSFEQWPRVMRYTLDGRALGPLPLPAPLSNVHAYQHPNRALEAITETRRYGVVVAPELALRDQPGTTIPLVSLDGPSFPFHPLDSRSSGLVGLETLPDDNLLVLERRYISPFRPLIIALSRVVLPDSPDAPSTQTEIARFDSSAGWSMDNFESVARHTGNRYFMISDDNASPLQHTLLLYFELLDEPVPGPDLPRPPLSRHRL